MKDNEAREAIRELRVNIEQDMKAIFTSLNILLNKPEPPILFQGLCKKCGKETTHRSYPNKANDWKIWATTSSLPIKPKELIKVCLSCNLETYED